MIDRKHSVEDILFYAGIVFFIVSLPIGIWYALFFLQDSTGISCFWRRTTGFYCPGCGGTRAVEALFQGQILTSFLYHPAVPYGAFLYVCFMGSQILARIMRYRYMKGLKFHLWMPVSVLIAVILNFVVKNSLWILWRIEIK